MKTKKSLKQQKTQLQTKEAIVNNEKANVVVKDKHFFNRVLLLKKLNEEIKLKKSEMEILMNEIKEFAKNIWFEMYSKYDKNPGTLVLDFRNNEGESINVLFIPSDKYLNIDEEKAKELKEKLSDDVVCEEIVFTIDNEMFKKYGTLLTDFIMQCEKIDEKDKNKIIKQSKHVSIHKGTIDKLNKYGKSIKECFEYVKPVVFLKI